MKRGVRAELAVADPGGVLHPVQGNVQQRRGDHPALRGSLLGRGEPTVLDHARLQPLRDQSPGGERAEHGQKVVMVDAVERRRQIRVEHPPALRVLALQRQVDGRDRVLTATAGPKPIGLRLEPCLPLGLQRVERPCLQHPVDDHGNTERALLPVPRFGMYTRLTGTSMPRLG